MSETSYICASLLTQLDDSFTIRRGGNDEDSLCIS